MTKELKAIVFDTDIGRVGILSSSRGILAVALPGFRGEKAMESWEKKADYIVPSSQLENLINRLERYLKGSRVDFPDRLDLSGATPFQRNVWQVTRLIPYGETRSYSWLARQVDCPRAARAVGQALGKNPMPVLIPCHRVISGNGAVGGFSGGSVLKKRLLEIENHVSRISYLGLNSDSYCSINSSLAKQK
jgi:methylated-DNA-[protein]-cysteine S-methyltransferase